MLISDYHLVFQVRILKLNENLLPRPDDKINFVGGAGEMALWLHWLAVDTGSALATLRKMCVFVRA